MNYKSASTDELVKIIDNCTWATSQAFIAILDELEFRGEYALIGASKGLTIADITNPDDPENLLDSPFYGLFRTD